MSVRLSVRMEQPDWALDGLSRCLILVTLCEPLKQIQVWWKSDKNILESAVKLTCMFLCR